MNVNVKETMRKRDKIKLFGEVCKLEDILKRKKDLLNKKQLFIENGISLEERATYEAMNFDVLRIELEELDSMSGFVNFMKREFEDSMIRDGE